MPLMRSLSPGRNKDKQVIILHKRGMDDSYRDTVTNSVRWESGRTSPKKASSAKS